MIYLNIPIYRAYTVTKYNDNILELGVTPFLFMLTSTVKVGHPPLFPYSQSIHSSNFKRNSFVSNQGSDSTLNAS